MLTLFFNTKFDGAKRVTGEDDDSDSEVREDCFFLFPPCLGCVSVFVCLVVMTVMYAIHKASPGLPLCCGSLCCWGWHSSSPRGGPRTFWTHTVLSLLGFLDTKEAALNFRDRTIGFEGNILPREPCVSSWPGKCESAWDALARASRGGHLSAAVVFLPEGSRHFGIDGPIPKAEDLPGSCWCTPLYGEQKPWGCRWWTHWIKHIEEAREKGAELQMYSFIR